jgi:hypothetical protein
MRRALLGTVLALAASVACSNAGEDRLLNVSADGVVRGLVYFDFDGNKVPSGPDDSVRNIRVRLITLNGSDTVASGLTLINGTFRITDVPVGTYQVVLDPAMLSDTAVIVQQDSARVTVLPADSNTVLIGISYPHVSIRTARTTTPIGRKVFLQGVVLNPPSAFSDTTMHIQDTSAAIRASRISATSSQPADSVRLRGTISTRAGQRTIDLVTVFPIAATFLPSATVATTLEASSAFSGARDAQQVLILNATVSDTNNPSKGPFNAHIMTVNDGSGAVDVLLDPAVGPEFRSSVTTPTGNALPGPYIPGNKFDIIGVLVPTGTGTWRVKPRRQADLVQR